MVSKSNHRTAFGSDAKFLARLAKQGISVGGDAPANVEAPFPPGTTVLEAATSVRKESRATSRMRKVREANMDGRRDRLSYDAVTNSLTAFFPGAMLLGLNVMLRVHNAKSTSLKATWLKRVEALRWESSAAFQNWLANAQYPVLVEEVYISGESTLLDHESVAAACKPVIDAFVVAGFLPDDNGRFVAQPLAYTERGDVCGVFIRFKPTPRPWGFIDDGSIEQARMQMDLKK